MSTINTEANWHYYIRRRGRNGYIGLVDDSGDPPDSSHNIDIFYVEIPDEVSSADDELPIPMVHEEGFIKGCVYELLMMYGKEVKPYKYAYEDMIREATSLQINETQTPAIINPLDMRND